MTDLEKLRFPIGDFEWIDQPPATLEKRRTLAILLEAPKLFRKEVEGLNESQLLTPYRAGGWTVAQVIHHLADSHAHAYLRCKHAALEQTPKIKGYNEGDWASIEDACSANVSPSLSMLDGIHHRWVSFFKSLNPDQFRLEYFHEEYAKKYPLYIVMNLYSWHSMHHLEHIRGLKKKMGW